MQHFEDLWNDCETQYSKEAPTSIVIVSEILLKIKLLDSLLKMTSDLSEEQVKESINLLIGEVLFGLTQLSASENINVFTALKQVYSMKLIDEASSLVNISK